MSRWKPANARRKGQSTASKGRLMSCLVVLASALLLLYLLFSQLLKAK